MVKNQFRECKTCNSRLKSIFCDLNEPALSEMSEKKHTCSYKKGDILFYENMKPFGIHCISSGFVKLYKTNSEGKQTLLKIAQHGDIIGFRAIFSEEPYASTGEVIEPATVCFIERATIVKLVQNNVHLALKAISTISKELGHYEEKLHSFAHKSVRERLAELLLILKESFGKKIAAGILLDIKLSRDEMAQMIGTAQESLIRLLSEFKDDQLICTQGRQIVITDLKKILDLAGVEL